MDEKGLRDDQGIGATGEDGCIQGAEDEGEEVQGEGPGEDQKILEKPESVTPEEEEKHRALGHPSFRNWCASCVRGKAQATGRPKKRGQRKRAEIQGDYMTMNSAGKDREQVREKGEAEHDTGSPIFV